MSHTQGPILEDESGTALPEAPTLGEIKTWMTALAEGPVEWLGPAESPVGVAAWYRTHLQTAEVRRAHGMLWLVLECTFCVHPRRHLAVLPMLAHANLQLEAGRWYRLARPLRLACALEVPAHGLDAERFGQVWNRFHDDVLTHGIELTLRTRADTWVHHLADQGRAPAGFARRPRKRAPRRHVEAT